MAQLALACIPCRNQDVGGVDSGSLVIVQIRRGKRTFVALLVVLGDTRRKKELER